MGEDCSWDTGEVISMFIAFSEISCVQLLPSEAFFFHLKLCLEGLMCIIMDMVANKVRKIHFMSRYHID